MIVQSYAPVMHVGRIDPALDFYVGLLGCRQAFRVGDYVGLELGLLRIHLAARDEHGPVHRPIGGGSLYVFCDDVDTLFERLSVAGTAILRPPEDTHYRLREMAVTDPDGNMLVFGAESD